MRLRFDLVVGAAGEAPPDFHEVLRPDGSTDAVYRWLAGNSHRLTDAAAHLVAGNPGGASLDNLVALIASRHLVVFHRVDTPAYAGAIAPAPRAAKTEDSANSGVNSESPAWIEYQFVDAADAPISGLVYELKLTTGAIERGTLPPDGRLRREPIPAGRCTARIGVIERANWGVETAGACDSVQLLIQADGFDAGTQVQCEVFRLYKEQTGDAIVTLTGVLDQSGQAALEWQPSASEPAHGQFIFKAQVGSQWKKSNVLTLARGIASARWSASCAHDGEEVVLQVETHGIADGATATFRIYEKDWITSDDLLDTGGALTASVTGGRATLKWKVVWKPDDEKTGCSDYIHYYFVVELDGMTGYSPLLEVWPVLEVSPEGAAAGARYCVRMPNGVEKWGVTEDGGRIRVPGARPGRAFASLAATPSDSEAGTQEA
ncbi:MAG: hypothetical protein U1D55_12600 [Phycisphaerae bacterium]